jgi:hypothetical protein
MTLPSVPDPEAARAKILPIVPLLYEAFEAAITRTRESFETWGLPHDPHLFPHLVRFFVRHWLGTHGKTVEDDEMNSVEVAALALEPVANSGLRFAYEDWNVRIFKAARVWNEEGDQVLELPPPGKSFAKQQFYRQQLGFRFDADKQENKFFTLNVVILWDIAPPWSLRLYLACPKNAGSARNSVQMYWPTLLDLPVPTPTTPEVEPAAEPELADDLENISVPETGDKKE